VNAWPHVAHFAQGVELRPALRARFQSIHAVIGDAFDTQLLGALYRDFEGELARTPELAELGFDLLRPGRTAEERRWGAVWLTHFPSPRMVEAMGAVLRDAEQPPPLRSQAAWTLGFRQVQERHPTLLWTPDVVRAANAELIAAYRANPLERIERLGRALLHVDDPELDAAFVEDPVRAAPAIDAFASPALARALLLRLAELRAEDTPRIIRLVGAVLGEEAGAPLLRFAEGAPLAYRYEAIFAALAVDPARARPAFEALVHSLQFPALVEARGQWHLAHPGQFPTVRATRFGRTSALVPVADRATRASEACADLEAMAPCDGLLWESLWDFWRHAAFLASGDGPRVRGCVEARPDTLRHAPWLLLPYLEALAAAGQLDTLERAAVAHGAAEVACWILARSGRPFRALAMRERVRRTTPAAAAGQALALFLGGRPDLAQRALDHDPPQTGDGAGASFPTDDDRWLAGHDPAQPYLRALAAREPASLLGLLTPLPDTAEADVFDVTLLERREQALRRDLQGRTACLLGRFADRSALLEHLATLGASVVDGPFAKSDCVIVGALDDGDRARLASLQAQGAAIVPVSDLFP
jgi:hypothetical protein